MSGTKDSAKPRLREILTSPRLGVVVVMGVASGLPFNLTEATMQAWLKDAAVSNTTIGWLSLVGLAYTLKPLWAPFLDRFSMPFLGRRRGWILIFQLALAATLAAMAIHGPEQGLASFAVLAVAVAFFSASQDIVIDAWRTDLVSAAERGPAATAANLGYRLAVWFSFAGALILADLVGWSSTYIVMAGGMLAVTLVTFLAPDPEQRAPPPRTLQEAVAGPLRQLLGGEGMLLLLLTIVLYKVGDAFALKLLTPFLMDVGFSKTEIGAVTKTVMLIANISGAVVGGLWLVGLGLVRALLLFGVVQAIANLGYFLVAVKGNNLLLMSIVVFLDNFVGSMGNTALVVLIMGICDVRFSAFQYAALSAIAVLPRNLLGAPAGILSDTLGWAPFFVLTFLTALPGLAMVWWQRVRITKLDLP